MRGTIICFLAGLWLTASPAWALSAPDLFNRGLHSSLASTKIKYFTAALEMDPSLAAAYEQRGLLYYFQGKFDKAIRDYARVVDLEPNQAQGHRMLGLCYLKKGEYQQAIGTLDRAIELDPRLASAYSYRAEAERLLGRLNQALRDATRAIVLNGDEWTTARAYATRGKIYRRMGQDELADLNFRKSFEIDPRSYFYRYFASTASLKTIHRLGLLGLLLLFLVAIFHLGLPAPRKRDHP